METRVWKLRGLVVLLVIVVAAAASAAGGGAALAAGSADVTPVTTTANDLLAGFTPPQPAHAAGVQRWEDAYRYDANGWTFLHIEGSPFHRGFGHGRTSSLRSSPRRGATSSTPSAGTPGRTGATSSRRPAAVREEAQRRVPAGDQGHRRRRHRRRHEDDLAAGPRLERRHGADRLLVAGRALTAPTRSGVDNTHCSAFIATGSYTSGGKVVMAHNDWDHFVTGQFANVIVDVKPAKGHRIIMQTFPGCIASMTDYFATDAGLMGTETTIGNYSSYDPKKPARVLPHAQGDPVRRHAGRVGPHHAEGQQRRLRQQLAARPTPTRTRSCASSRASSTRAWSAPPTATTLASTAPPTRRSASSSAAATPTSTTSGPPPAPAACGSRSSWTQHRGAIDTERGQGHPGRPLRRLPEPARQPVLAHDRRALRARPVPVLAGAPALLAAGLVSTARSWTATWRSG